MSARATVRTGDLNRYLEAAKKHGYAVEIRGDVVRLLPMDAVPNVPSDSAVTPAQEALKKWRRSA